MLTEIVCTLGPATDDGAVLRGMLAAGMSYARLNFSHGEAADHRKRATAVREAAQATGHRVLLIQDLQGPKIRTVRTPNMVLEPGDPIWLESEAPSPEVKRREG